MSNYDQHRDHAFDTPPPTRRGTGAGALIFIAGIVVLFILALLFMGGTDGAVPEERVLVPTEPAVETTTPAVADE